MSQQSQFEEEGRNYQYGYKPTMQDDDFAHGNGPYEGGQKVFYTQPASQSQKSFSAGQRLALAIVSVCVLIPLVAIILEGNVSSDTAGNFLLMSSRLIALALVCLTIMIVNVAANWRR